MTLNSLLALQGRVAAVAGGAGAIGSAISVRLVECGVTVYCLDQSGRSGPQGTMPVACDLTDERAVADAVADIDRRSGRLDILVHAAGITRDGRVWKTSAEDWNRVITTNLTSAFHLLHAAVPVMRRNGAGAIVLISSINGERGKVGLSSYAASKAGLNALARTAGGRMGRRTWCLIRWNCSSGWRRWPSAALRPPRAWSRGGTAAADQPGALPRRVGAARRVAPCDCAGAGG